MLVQRCRIQFLVDSMRNDECGFKATPGQIRQNRCIGFRQTDHVVDLPGLVVLTLRILVSVGWARWFVADWGGVVNRQGRCTWVANGRLSVVRGPVVPGGCPGGTLGLAVLVGGKSQWDLSMGLVISSGGVWPDQDFGYGEAPGGSVIAREWRRFNARCRPSPV